VAVAVEQLPQQVAVEAAVAVTVLLALTAQLLELIIQVAVVVLDLMETLVMVVLELLLLDMLNRRYRWHTLHN
jgi:hypothetical protein